MSTATRGVTVLGSTGSVGTSTLDVIARHAGRFHVHALSARRSVETMLEQVRAFSPRYAVMLEEAAADELAGRLSAIGSDTVVLQGATALEQVAADPDTDIVVAAIVGAAGLLSTLAAASSGKQLLLANKESLVMSGQLLRNAARASGARILPLDSEHNAIFQCLPVIDGFPGTRGVTRILLTASGGPLRTLSRDALAVVTPQQALKHPNWSMGPKISIDSATLMNKGLEVIEACVLFDVPLSMIEVIVHPESVVHSMVAYEDGSVLAQLGQPDMRTPIANALAWPERIESGVAPLDFTRLAGLRFEKPDTDRFPCLRLAFEAQRAGGLAPTVLNAANEVAVDAFLAGTVSFLQLPNIIENTLLQAKNSPATDLPTIIEADANARQLALDNIGNLAGRR